MVGDAAARRQVADGARRIPHDRRHPLDEHVLHPHGTRRGIEHAGVTVGDVGQIIAQGTRDQDEVIVADLDLEEIAEVRATWQFFRDRRPETYGGLTAL